MNHADTIHGSAERQRALRILEATTGLVLRLGYQKVTVDDIAAESGVGKGTIYLHWRSKKDLLYALIAKEMAVVAEGLMDYVLEHPDNIRLHRLYPELYVVCNARPLVRALFTQDAKVLGNVVRQENSRITQWQKMLGMTKGIGLMRDHGLVCSEMDLDLQLYAINSLLLGMFMLDCYQPNVMAARQKASALSVIVRSSFEPQQQIPVPPAVVQAILAEFARLLQVYESVIYPKDKAATAVAQAEKEE